MKASVEVANIVEGSYYEAMSTAFLIRHGESEANAGLPTIDPKDAGLTLLGHKQAKRIAEYLKFHPLDLIVTSPYLRTKQTAAFTQSLFPSVPLTQWEVQEFTYLTSIHQEHLTIQDRRLLMDAYWEQRLPTDVDGPGSESFEAFIKRVREFLTQLENRLKPTEKIAVFSHEQFIIAVLWLIDCKPTAIDWQAMRDFKNYLKENRVSNGTIVRMQFRHRQHYLHLKQITKHLTENL